MKTHQFFFMCSIIWGIMGCICCIFGLDSILILMSIGCLCGGLFDWIVYGNDEDDTEEPEFLKVPLNLQQWLVWSGKTDITNSVRAIVDLHHKTVVIRPEFKSSESNILSFIGEGTEAPFKVIYGDSFSCDTWDKKIAHLPPRFSTQHS